MSRHATLIALLACLLVSWMSGSATAAWQEFIYSGRDLHDVLADVAKRGKLNLIVDLPHTTIAKFALRSPDGELEPEGYFWEEALFHLAIACHFRVIKEGPFHLLLADGQERRLQDRMVIRKIAGERPGFSFGAVAVRLVFGSLKAWSDPHRNALFLAGFKDELDLMKQTLETLDTPVYPLRCEAILKDGAGGVIASFTLRALANQPFRVERAPAASASWAWDVQGTPRMDFDGNALLAPFHLSLRTPQGSCLDLEAPLKSLDGVSENFGLTLAGQKLSFTWRTTAERSDAFLAPPGHRPITDFSQGDPEEIPTGRTAYEAADGTGGADGKPLDLIQDDVSAVKVMERFALDDDLELICDDSASGAVSLFLFGARPEPADLIRGVARCKGLDVFAEGRHLAVARPASVRDMITADRQPIVFGGSPDFPAEKVEPLLREFFRILGLEGRIQPESGSANHGMLVSGEPLTRKAVKLLLASWLEPSAELAVGFSIESVYGKLDHRGEANPWTALQKGVTLPQGSLACRVQPLDSGEEGSRLVAFQTEGRDNLRGRLRVKAVSRVPEAGFPLFELEGELQFRLTLEGQTNRTEQPATPPQFASEPVDAAFDSNF